MTALVAAFTPERVVTFRPDTTLRWPEVTPNSSDEESAMVI